MKKLLLATILVAATISFTFADLQMPKKPNFYDKLGRGVANLLTAPTHILDSTYGITQMEGGTVGYTKGFVQGTSRTVMDVFHGVFDIVTSPFPSKSLKQPQYDTGVVQVYPPADLLDNWY